MSIQTKTVSELKGLDFFVPSYQRGYRWTELEVKALIEDINEFSTDGEKRYCLQPLIVKRRKDGTYEVVDGQQRLTTVYIFMKIAEQEIRSATPPYRLEYKTRTDSADFLQSLSDELDMSAREENIDYYHMANAYDAINQWLSEQEDLSVAIQDLNTKFRRNVFFIWYEIPEETDPIEIFTNVNLGKIPLTNAELIKALLLNNDNFVEESNKRQIEISTSWDRIEQGLRDDSFWYFLNEKEQSGTRIDLLFQILAEEKNKTLATPISLNEKYFSFLVFSQLYNSEINKEKFVKIIWEELERIYSEFQEWYSDLNKYHIIGYLIHSGVSINDIVRLVRGKKKSIVRENLLEKAKSITGEIELENLSYELPSNRNKIRRILFLFNIATLVCKSEKQYRFPFDIYKGETKERLTWDIEHIHATNDESEEPDDSIGNLALLDSSTNRNYKDESFHIKRSIIIKREENGLFVPLCTKNVFLKLYSKNPGNLYKWENTDKEDYVNAIETITSNFLNGRFE